MPTLEYKLNRLQKEGYKVKCVNKNTNRYRMEKGTKVTYVTISAIYKNIFGY